MNKKVRVVGSAILSAVLAQSMIPAQIFAQEDQNPTEKAETVYTVLNADGSVNNTIVSSWLHDDDGIIDVQEKLDIKDVENVKSDEEPKVDGDTYTWNSESHDIYYQGKTEKALPISVQIRYELDGKEMSSDQVQGKSGHLKMHIQFTNSISKIVNVHGKAVHVYPSYIGGGLLTLDTEHYANVKCENGKIVNDGTNEILAFATAPGLAETLQEVGLQKVSDRFHIADDTIIEADVTDFDLSSMMIGFTNEMSLDQVMNDVSFGDLTSGLSTLFSASDQLLEGSQALLDGTKELNEKAQPLLSAYPKIDQLTEATTLLYEGSSQVENGLLAYTQGVSDLNAGNQKLYGIVKGSSDMQMAVQSNLLTGSKQLSQGLQEFDATIQKVDMDQFAQMGQQLEAASKAMDTLNGIMTKDMTVLTGMDTQLDQAIKMLSSLDTSHLEKALMHMNETVQKDNLKIQEFNANLSKIKEQSKASLQTLEAARKEIQDQGGDVSALDTQIDAYRQSVEALNTLDELETFSSQDLQVMQESMQQLQKALGSMKQMVSGAIEQLKGLQEDMKEATKILTGLQQSLGQAQNALPTELPAMIAKMKAASKQLMQGSVNLTKGVETLNASMLQLVQQSQAGVDAVNHGSATLDKNSEALTAGMHELTLGTQQLQSNNDQFSQMSQGLQQLQGALDTLQDGAGQLVDGQTQFNEDGMGTLKEMLDLTSEELNTLKVIMQAVDTINQENMTFTGAPQGAQSAVRFLFKTSTSSKK